MERSSVELMKIAIERGYVDDATARTIGAEAALRRCSAERILLERRLMSTRRLERLRAHVRYRAMRKADKRYGRVALSLGIVDRRAIELGLLHQRQVFERRRDCLRLGSYLIERRLLSADEDRDIRARLSGGTALVPLNDRRNDRQSGSSAQTLAVTSSSAIQSSSAGGAASYRAIEAALERVEKIRAIQEELSVSENHGQPAGLDSAAEFEDACRILAQRRMVPASERRASGSRRRSGKGTGALRGLLGGRGAA